MVDKPDDNKLDSEIAKRLDDLFGEGDTLSGDENPVEAEEAVAEEDQVLEEQPSAKEDEVFALEDEAADEADGEQVPDDYPLAELKNLVLYIDWEITDEALADFLAQIDSLKATYKNDKIVLKFLQLLGSLGVYIKTNRGNAHPKTFKILNSAFSSLEEVVRSEDMAATQKKELLGAEMKKYKQLRSQVSKKKAAKVSRKPLVSAPKELETLIKAPRQKEAAASGRKAPQKAVKQSQQPGIDTPQSLANLADAVEELKKFIHSELNALKQELRILQKSK